MCKVCLEIFPLDTRSKTGFSYTKAMGNHLKCHVSSEDAPVFEENVKQNSRTAKEIDAGNAADSDSDWTPSDKELGKTGRVSKRSKRKSTLSDDVEVESNVANKIDLPNGDSDWTPSDKGSKELGKTGRVSKRSKRKSTLSDDVEVESNVANEIDSPNGDSDWTPSDTESKKLSESHKGAKRSKFHVAKEPANTAVSGAEVIEMKDKKYRREQAMIIDHRVNAKAKRHVEECGLTGFDDTGMVIRIRIYICFFIIFLISLGPPM